MRDQVLAAVHSGRVKMRPRWQFILRAMLGGLGGVLLALGTLYLVSFTIFVLRRTGVWFVPVFGSRGWFAFFSSLPWLLIFFSILFLVVLELLVRHYAFAYRRPVIYSILGLMAFAVFGGLLLAETPFHGQMYRFSDENRVPFARDLYRGFGDPQFQNIYPGRVTALTPDGFFMQSRRRDMVRVLIGPETRLPFGAGFAPDERVVVFGERQGDLVRAFGIRRVDVPEMSE